MLRVAGSVDEARAKGVLAEYTARRKAWKSVVCQFQTLDHRCEQLFRGSPTLGFVAELYFPARVFHNIAVSKVALDDVYKGATGGLGQDMESGNSASVSLSIKKNTHYDQRRACYYSMQARARLCRKASVLTTAYPETPIYHLPLSAAEAGESFLSSKFINGYIKVFADERAEYCMLHQKAFCRSGSFLQIDHHMKLGLAQGDLLFTVMNEKSYIEYSTFAKQTATIF